MSTKSKTPKAPKEKTKELSREDIETLKSGQENPPPEATPLPEPLLEPENFPDIRPESVVLKFVEHVSAIPRCARCGGPAFDELTLLAHVPPSLEAFVENDPEGRGICAGTCLMHVNELAHRTRKLIFEEIIRGRRLNAHWNHQQKLEREATRKAQEEQAYLRKLLVSIVPFVRLDKRVVNAEHRVVLSRFAQVKASSPSATAEEKRAAQEELAAAEAAYPEAKLRALKTHLGEKEFARCEVHFPTFRQDPVAHLQLIADRRAAAERRQEEADQQRN